MLFMRKIGFVVLITSLAFCGTSRANGDITKCFVKVLAIKLKDTTQDWHTVTINKEINLLSDDTSFSFTNEDQLPPGNYLNFRIVLSETVKVSGSDGKNLTKEGGEITIGGTAAKASDMPQNEILSFKQTSPTWNTEKEGVMKIHFNFDHEDFDDFMEIYPKKDFAKPLTIQKGSVVRVSFLWDLRNLMQYVWEDYFSGIKSDQAMFFLPSKDVSEVSLKSDAQVVLLTADSLDMEF